MKNITLLFFVVLTLVACAKSPTGRSQFIIVGAEQMSKMGIESFDNMKQEQPVSTDKKLTAYVQCVADPILKVLPAEWQNDWEIVVFDSEQINAFALPGRKIGVYTGILQVTENADQLAAIVGHEVGHVIANHGAERVSQGTAAQKIAQGVSVLTKGSEYHKEISAGLGIGAQYGVLMPFSRLHESEADVLGLQYLMLAGYKPEESQKLWQNMAKVGGKRQMEILSTHPAPETRINNLGKHIKKYRAQGIKPLFKRAACSK
ncbi:peptidase [Saccharobesus litoralis]|uniref:Peptidase n=1 Tax=Saccharobesus litoralis TaxID=2172099 RepID=A0A2S0VLD6_9ALTE|nr:M48 family metallopeptidase [Saccharobesus litoralis]AWB65023.1 peptidase [Saccharobesus litoralis]